MKHNKLLLTCGMSGWLLTSKVTLVRGSLCVFVNIVFGTPPFWVDDDPFPIVSFCEKAFIYFVFVGRGVGTLLKLK